MAQSCRRVDCRCELREVCHFDTKLVQLYIVMGSRDRDI